MFRDSFYGQKISDYGRKYGFVDYHALASSFDAVLCNSILNYRDGFEDWEQVHGFVDNSEAIADASEELEEVLEKLESVTEAKKEAENNLEDLERALENIGEILEKFDSFEYEANELHEAVEWLDCETPSGDDLDTSTLTNNLDCIDLWAMREAIEDHQSTVEEQHEEAEERLEAIEEELEKLKSRKLELEAKIDELENEDTTNAEIYQWYIISGSGAQILEENTNEILYYNEELDIYVWGVTHWGTSWDYVLTSIPCETYEQQKQREAEEAKPKEIGDFTDEELDQMTEELLNLWDADEDEGETIEAEKEPTADDATPTEAETVEADKPQHEDVQLLRTWQTIAKIERAIDEETKRIRTEEGTAYANECYRMMRHNFDIGDIVAHEDGGMPWRVSDMDRLGDTLDIELDGEHLTVNRWEVFGISSKGEEVRTPCTDEELETLKEQRMWM